MTTATEAAPAVSQKRYVGKVTVVTGGNSGIGLATAKAFAREGARVIITGRNEKTLVAAKRELGDSSIGIKLDVSRVADIDKAMDQIKREAGHIDVLFVNAGIAEFRPFTEETEATFDATIDTNVKGAFFTVQRALPLLKKGSVVVLNASAAAHMALPSSSVYSASKAALLHLGRMLGAELVAQGIRVNVVSPGPIQTPIFDRNQKQTQQEKDQTSDWIRNMVPLKRFGTGDEIAEAVLFLASPAAAFITGTELRVDGGVIGLR